jgi:WhiB family transcriptional regulator, redox-sensing transcriptional regulator
MTGHSQDHQPPGPQPLPGPVLHRRPRVGIAVLGTVGSTSWMSRSACRGEDPELFFPIAASGSALAQVSSAKAVCGRCPVQANCLSYALLTEQSDGIWGGTTREERWSGRYPRSGPRPYPPDQDERVPGQRHHRAAASATVVLMRPRPER